MVWFVLPQTVHHQAVVGSGRQAYAADVLEHMFGPGVVLGKDVHQMSAPVWDEYAAIGSLCIPIIVTGAGHSRSESVIRPLKWDPRQDLDAQG